MPAFDIPGNYAFDTYDELVAAINDWMDRSDLTGSAGSMVALAEARMRRLFTPLFNEAVAVISVVDGLGILPDDYGAAIRVTYNGIGLKQASDYAGTLVFDGSQPVAYAFEQGQLRLWPECTVSVEMLYQPTIPALSSETPSNYLLTLHPDLYFFGSMLFASGYLANDNRAASFKALWDEAIAEAKIYFTRQKFIGQLIPYVAHVP